MAASAPLNPSLAFNPPTPKSLRFGVDWEFPTLIWLKKAQRKAALEVRVESLDEKIKGAICD
jgi:hypothetical protein